MPKYMVKIGNKKERAVDAPTKKSAINHVIADDIAKIKNSVSARVATLDDALALGAAGAGFETIGQTATEPAETEIVDEEIAEPDELASAK